MNEQVMLTEGELHLIERLVGNELAFLENQLDPEYYNLSDFDADMVKTEVSATKALLDKVRRIKPV